MKVSKGGSAEKGFDHSEEFASICIVSNLSAGSFVLWCKHGSFDVLSVVAGKCAFVPDVVLVLGGRDGARVSTCICCSQLSLSSLKALFQCLASPNTLPPSAWVVSVCSDCPSFRPPSLCKAMHVFQCETRPSQEGNSTY